MIKNEAEIIVFDIKNTMRVSKTASSGIRTVAIQNIPLQKNHAKDEFINKLKKKKQQN